MHDKNKLENDDADRTWNPQFTERPAIENPFEEADKLELYG